MKNLLALAVSLLVLAAPAGAAGTVSAAGAWSRPAVDTGVVYLTLVNSSSRPDRLLAAASPVARAVELHESTTSSMSGMKGMSGMSGTSGGEMVSMHEVKAIPVPPRGRTTLGPGGYHIMLIGLKRPLTAGSAFPLRLRFAHAGWESVVVHVRAMG